METSTVLTVLGLVFAPLFAWWIGRRMTKAEIAGKETQNALNKKDIVKELEATMAQQSAQTADLLAEKLQTKILAGQLDRVEAKWEKIVENNGYVRRSEEICNERLTAAETELSQMREQFKKYGSVHDLAAQQAAALQQLQDEGKWNGNPKLLEAV